MWLNYFVLLAFVPYFVHSLTPTDEIQDGIQPNPVTWIITICTRLLSDRQFLGFCGKIRTDRRRSGMRSHWCILLLDRRNWYLLPPLWTSSEHLMQWMELSWTLEPSNHLSYRVILDALISRIILASLWVNLVLATWWDGTWRDVRELL